MVLFSFSCHQFNHIKVNSGFYYWKSSSRFFDSIELSLLHITETKKLYIKFFEINRDKSLGNIPISKNELNLSYFSLEYYNNYKEKFFDIDVIPTVYINNNVFKFSNKVELDSLVSNTLFLIHKKFESNYSKIKKRYNEIQIDCDWTESSKENYFYFLSKIKSISKYKISTTLRLYPFKYREKMGVPPVNSVTLMCYNLISPLNANGKNSILDVSELKSYLKDQSKYPIKIDIALPIFQWYHVYRNNEFIGVINEFDLDNNKTNYQSLKENLIQLTNNIELDKYELFTGDIIKIEKVDYKLIQESIDVIKKELKLGNEINVILFHLDSEVVKHFKNNELQNIYNRFNS